MTDQGIVPRVVIADDHSGILDQAIALLRQDFEIVATARDGMFALDCIRRLDPDMAVLDLYMPGMNGLDVVRTLQESGTRTVTVILSGYSDPDLAKAAVTAGAKGFVAKSRLVQDLLPAMRGAVQGHVFVSALPPNKRS